MKIGFIGNGEAAFELSRGLKEEGLTDICAFDVMKNSEQFGEQIKNRAAQAKVELKEHLADAVSNVDILFVAVPADNALEVHAEIQPHLKNTDLIYVDVSASTPKVKQELENSLQSVDIKFVDAAMLGPLPVYKHKVPISASGSGTEAFIQRMMPYNMNITSVGKQAGDASAIKLIRSIFMKGIVGLYLETLQASEKFNVSDEVLASLEETMDRHSFMDTLNRLVTGSAVHAKRRAIELQGSIDMLKEVGYRCKIGDRSKG